eukprot:89249-Chlamydomonas_euryale.AAC.2
MGAGMVCRLSDRGGREGLRQVPADAVHERQWGGGLRQVPADALHEGQMGHALIAALVVCESGVVGAA